MRTHYFIQKIFAAGVALLCSFTMHAQQLPDPSFEDWSGAAFDGKIQPKHWHFSNVEQLGIKFNLAHQEAGHTGKYSMMVQCTKVGAMGITEEAPGYIALGQPWQCLPSITEIKKATAGTYGGISWTYRPDSMQVWVKRTGNNTANEDFHLLYYAWNGTAKGSSYKGKDNSCTSYNATDEESDIRQALDKNECVTTQYANQVAEGWHRARAQYNEWTCITVPIYYFNDEAPTKCNVLFSASNYPNFRANSGLYEGNALYVDDVKMIYSSKIQKLYVGNKEWKSFDPNSTEEQTYSLGNATSIPDIYAVRGAGTLTNAHGGSASFTGRKLTGSEISIQKGTIDGAATVITVTAEDGSSSTTYKIKFVSKPSENARLAGIQVNGEPLSGFNSYVSSYNVALPYGTTAAPVVTYTAAEDAQTISCTQATSPTGKATIEVTAADGKTKFTYTLNFSVALLSDNTLQDILIDGVSLPGFKPEYTTYNRVELPLGTTVLPKIEAVSAYPAGAQTITHTAPSVIDGGQYQIAVSTPGNPTPKVYKLNFKITASTNTLLKNLQAGSYITNFDPELTTYYVTLPIGTTELPTITYEKGDQWQTVTVENEGTDGTTRVTVTAASGDQRVYKIVFSTEKSDVDYLKNIYLDGVPLAGFSPDVYVYDYQLPIGTTELPEITYDKGDEYQIVTVKTDGLNGTTRITVVADNGTTVLYQIKFSVLKANDATLKMIYVNGDSLAGFEPTKLEYTVNLPQGTTAVPTLTWDKADEWQTVMYRAATSLTGESKITVRPQEGSSQTYVIRFSVNTSSNTDLLGIALDGVALADFQPDKLEYTITLPEGVSTIPNVTFTKAEEVQRVIALQDGTRYILHVIAENGASKEYVLNFIIQKSENAFLKMIYLDGDSLEGFKAEKLSGYVVELETNSCPTITVDKEAGQQVNIIVPAGAGEAQIIVQPEAGAANTYIIEFKKVVAVEVQLKNIFLNGAALEGFAANKYLYEEIPYEKELPIVTYEAMNQTQTVTVLRDKETITLMVVDGSKQNTYTLKFARQYEADARLKSILLDGENLAGFTATTLHYTIPVAAGAKVPTVSYEKNTPTQTVVAGALSETEYQLHVTAENGAVNVYQLTFDLAQYADVTLLDLLLDGTTISGFEPTKTTYTVELEEGTSLPTLTYRKRDGQSILMAQTTQDQQQIIVVAENGAQSTYTVNYVYKRSSNALLADILVNGTALEGFAPTTFNYVDTLAWRTRVVPVLNPVAGNPEQKITTYYSSVNGTTKIHVVAADGKTTKDYTIAFPVVKSSNTLLDNVMCTEEFEFVPTTNDYVITLPYGKNEAPLLLYEVAEVEQMIRYVAAPLGDTTKIIVTAENGDERVYRFFFHQTISDLPNRLKSIIVNDSPIDMSLAQEIDAEHIEVKVPLPYGTTAFHVGCVTNYDEQRYFLQPGGTQRPTIVTLYPNRGEEKVVTYTITPQIEQQNPAHLTSIRVNGTEIEAFDKNRLEYIVNIYDATNTPVVTYTNNQGVNVEAAVPTYASWHATVSAEGNTNTYRVYFHYPNDVIPNGEFTSWTTATNNNAPKPTGWNVISDAVSGGTDGKEVSNVDNTIVHLAARYWAGPGGDIPAFITLGNVSGKLGIAGSNNFTVEGGISFRNTPDIMSVNYKLTSVISETRGTHFSYELWGSKGNHKVEHSDIAEINDYTTLDLDLTKVNDQVGIPSQMNIILNAYCQETGQTGTAGTILGSKNLMYIDWVRFSYNSKLKSITMAGEDTPITPTGNAFTYSIEDSEASTLVPFTLTGEVADQAHKIVWGEETREGDKAKRVATIINYAEDGTSTVYTLTVTRPLSQANKLAGLEISKAFTFNKDVTKYTINLSANEPLPTMIAQAASNRQQVEMKYADDKVIITVTPEYGTAMVYTISFVRTKSSDTTLKSLTATGVEYDAATHDYAVVADVMPTITFEKNNANQWVDLCNGVLHVTAEDGTVGTYTITLTPATKTTSGLLKTLSLDGGLDIKGWDKNTFAYTEERPKETSFVREFDQDSVIHTITPAHMTWQIIGTQANTYTLTYPTERLSDVNLSSIMLDGDTIPDFLAERSDYTITTDATVELEIPAQKRQSYMISYADNVFTINIMAEDSTLRNEAYTIHVLPDLSSSASLQMIYLDGVALADFHADSLKYAVELPCANPKTSEPQLPNITYDLGQESQHVEVEVADLGGTNYLTVTSEDGNHIQTYELTITAEPSHNVSLNNILVNGVQVKGFDPERYWYSAQTQESYVYLQYSSDDAFQTVKEKRGEDGEYILEVTAQDGVTQKCYYVELWNQIQSNNAYLKNILIDNKTFSEYDPTSADFHSKQLRYNIRIPENATLLPDVYVALQEEGQQWKRLSGEDVDTIRVTAPDGITTNDYIINFIRVKSSNANLQNILLDGEPLATFNPEKTIYSINLPIGTQQLPTVDALKSESTQQVTITTEENTTHISVTAEDGTPQSYWLIFTILRSEADTLQMLYEDGVPMAEFVPTTFYYATTLPEGVRTIPELGYEKADQWQTVTIDTIQAARQTTYQLHVQAENGNHNTYTVVYTVQASSIDTLKMIYLDNQELQDFTANRTDYTITLQTDEDVPTISWLAGNDYQTIDTVTLGNTTKLTVRAENSATRTYMLTFVHSLSSNATLSMIQVAGEDIANFDGEVLTYDIALPYGTTSVPVISFTKAEEAQNVTLTITGWTAQISVLAADGRSTQTYTLNFTVNRSNNAYLHMIRLDGKMLQDFEPQKTEYDIILPLGTKTLPVVTWETGDEQQTVRLDTISTTSLALTVTSGNEEATTEYILNFHFAQSPVNTLSDLALDGTTINGFKPEVNEYYIIFEPNTPTSELYTIEDVTFALTDPLATATAFAQDAFTLVVLVTAENGASNAYLIHQEISLPNNALLADLQINGNTVEGFAPEIFAYEYLLLDGGVMPMIDAIPQDSTAEVSITIGNIGDTTYIYCTAQDGTEYVYTVYVHYTDLRTTAPATDQDVIFKHIPGTNQFIAATTRQGVQIMILNLNGQKILLEKVPTCDPNNISVTIDANGNELLTDVDINAPGTIITIDDYNTPFFYLFLQNESRKVATGKIMLTQ